MKLPFREANLYEALTASNGAEPVPRGAGRLSSRKVLRVAVFTAMVLAVWQVGLSPHYMNPDGIAYLDMGDRIWDYGWTAAANAYWSPLYPALLGTTMNIFRPSVAHEFLLAHAVNLVVFVLALGAFTFFWRRLTRVWECWTAARAANILADEHGTFTRPAWMLFGYSLFVWASLLLTRLANVAPDLLTSVFVYIAAGLLLAIYSGERGWRTYLLLGTVLGLAYLAKAVMFPLACVFFAVAMLASGRMRYAPRLAVGAALFAAISATWMVPISRKTDHMTFGESGALNYVWYVDGVSSLDHVPAGFSLVHPAIERHVAPAVYEYAGDVSGSYPFWDDPSYWLAGMKPHFVLEGQVKNLVINLGRLLVLPGLTLWAGGLLLLAFHQSHTRLLLRRLTRVWVLWAPGLVAVGLYSLVLVEGRYLAPFSVMIAGAILLVVANGAQWDRIAPALALTAAVIVTLAVLVDTAVESVKVRKAGQDGSADLRAAIALRQHGIPAGARVGCICDAYSAAWARLDRVSIDADITVNETPQFWSAPMPTQKDIVAAFRRAGVTVIIGDPPAAPAPPWKQLTGTKYYLYDLRGPTG